MKLTFSNEFYNNTKVVTLQFSLMELVYLQLSDADKALIERCNKSERVSDIVAGLALLARRIEESEMFKLEQKNDLPESTQ